MPAPLPAQSPGAGSVLPSLGLSLHLPFSSPGELVAAAVARQKAQTFPRGVGGPGGSAGCSCVLLARWHCAL